ncbi:MAG: PfkB family carbohydrate kinase [Christensenellales bacterium]
MIKALAFGEALWDVFPGGRKLGGAPLNFCAHLARMGALPYLYSAVGDDGLGDEIREIAAGMGVLGDFIHIAYGAPTGVCDVTFDKKGEPVYSLPTGVAYDNIPALEESLRKIGAMSFDSLYFGTLAQRGKKSKLALQEIISRCRFKEIFCDINLRQDFYSPDLIRFCLESATILKINRFERDVLAAMGFAAAGDDSPESLADFCRELCIRQGLKIIIVTLDSDGAAAYSRETDQLLLSGRIPAREISPVGAGDSFSACFLYNHLKGCDLQSCLDRANLLGAYVVEFEEAVPDYSADLLRRIISP